MKQRIFWMAVILSLSITACNDKTEIESTTVPTVEPPLNQNKTEMKSHLSLFEIPVLDISRAINFYQAVLDIHIERMEMPGMEMGIFPYEDQMVSGVLMKGEGYKPSADGVTIYLNRGDNLQNTLDKVVQNGGKILVPKTAHADESGFFALFLDTEGNKLGLNAPN